MKIVLVTSTVLDREINKDALRELGELLVFSENDVLNRGIADCVGDADILIGAHRHVTPADMDCCSKLKLIVIHATGYDPLDIAHARQRGITVCNCPGYGTQSVAQHAIALLLELTNRVGKLSEQVGAGRWKEAVQTSLTSSPLMELSEKTLGIIGFGRIGKCVGKMASGLGMNVIANNPSRSCDGQEIAEYVSLDELLKKSDVISLHCPSSKENYHLINRETIEKMKPGVILINDARGDLVDENALAEALITGKISAAALDVLEREPIAIDNPLLKMPNCIITPHIAWGTPEAQRKMGCIILDTVKAYINGHPINTVN